MLTYILCAALCGPAVFTEIQPGDSHDESVAYAAALLIHDQSIRSLEWYQQVSRCNTPNGPLEVVQTAREGMDELGRSYQHWVVTFPDENGIARPWRPSFSSDGITTTAFDADSKSSLIRFPEPEPAGYPTPLLLLGRYVEATGKRPLGELLLAMPDLQIEKALDSAGIVRLGGVLVVNNITTRIHVDIDTTKSYAPVRIEVNDILSGLPLEIIYTTRFERYLPSHAPLMCETCEQAIWIPVAGRRETFTISDNDETRASLDQFRKIIDQSGVNKDGVKPGDDRTQHVYKDAIKQVFGDKGVPFSPLAPHLHLATCVILNLNAPIHESAFRSANAPALQQANLILNINSRGEPFDDPDTDLSEAEKSKSQSPSPSTPRTPRSAPTPKE